MFSIVLLYFSPHFRCLYAVAACIVFYEPIIRQLIYSLSYHASQGSREMYDFSWIYIHTSEGDLPRSSCLALIRRIQPPVYTLNSLFSHQPSPCYLCNSRKHSVQQARPPVFAGLERTLEVCHNNSANLEETSLWRRCWFTPVKNKG